MRWEPRWSRVRPKLLRTKVRLLGLAVKCFGGALRAVHQGGEYVEMENSMKIKPVVIEPVKVKRTRRVFKVTNNQLAQWLMKDGYPCDSGVVRAVKRAAQRMALKNLQTLHMAA